MDPQRLFRKIEKIFAFAGNRTRISLLRTVQWFVRLDAGLSLRRFTFDVRPISMGFVVYELAQGHIFRRELYSTSSL